MHIIGFLSQWKVYLDTLPSAPGEAAEAFKGQKLDTTVFEKVRRLALWMLMLVFT